MSPSASYDLTKLKPDGSHYVAISFTIPHYLHLPDDNYLVYVADQITNKSVSRRLLAVQVILEKKQKAISQAELHLVQRELWEMAGAHGFYGFSSITVYMPVRGGNPETHQDFKKMWNQVEKDHLIYKDMAASAINNLITVYRYCTGESHIRQLAGDDLRFEYNFAFFFNENPVEMHVSKFRGQVLPLYNLFDRLPANLNIPSEIVADIQTKLAENFEIPLSEELLLNAYDLMEHGNYRLAVMEAETAFEAAVLKFLRQYYKDEPDKIERIEGIKSFGYLINQDFFKNALASRSKTFRKNEAPRKEWDEYVWGVRGALVHGRISDITYEEAIIALETVEKTLEYLLNRPTTKPWRYAGPKNLL